MNPIARLKALINRLLPRASFARSVGVLAGGTAAAQAIGVLVLPVITRLYSPADFSVLAVYASILGIVAGVACLRLDIAIPLPERDEDAANLLAVALLCSTGVAMLAALAVWWFPERIVNAAGQPGLQPFLWMIPLGILLASAYSSIQFWATRKKRFTAIARTRVGQTTGSTLTQLAGGLFNALGPFGLLLGQLIGSGAGVFGLGRAAWREDQQALRGITWADMRRVFFAHDRFVKYSTFEAFANNGAIQLPVIIIAAVAVGPEAGYLFLAMRAMAIPIGLIGGAVSQVYLSRAPEEYRAGRLAPFTLKAIAGLMHTGVGPLLFAGIVSPVAFPVVFGTDWQRAGEMVAWMTPWFILQFVSSPVSMSLHVTKNQR
ncbi:MAG: lipopolysaccharide biosynthesis protein, partial [Acidovorax defluvii]